MVTGRCVGFAKNLIMVVQQSIRSDCTVIGRRTVTTVVEVPGNVVQEIVEVVEPENLLKLEDWAALGETASPVFRKGDRLLSEWREELHRN